MYINIVSYMYNTQVKISLYKEGVEKAYIIFDGKGSNNIDWFDANRILQSSWTDIQEQTIGYFSVHG